MTTRDWLAIIPTVFAAFSPFLLTEPGSRFSRHREAKIRTLSEQAETAELHSAVRQTLLAQVHELIAWETARRKYPSRVSFWPTYLLFVAIAVPYSVLSLIGLMGSPSFTAMTLPASVALAFSVALLIRVIFRTDTETTRIHLCKATNMGDIDPINPLFPPGKVVINAFRLRGDRNPEMGAPGTCVILRRAHLHQLRNDGVDPATLGLIEESLPDLSDFARWTAMAPAIGTHNINAVIREPRRP